MAEHSGQVKLLAVVFRHGDRSLNPNVGESYPNDPYRDLDIFPVGPGNLTNNGKLRAFNLGQALRTRYNKFLGNIYYPELIKARSTDCDRTKMSLQLVLNGLFPPASSQQWKDGIDWQPIPTEYFPLEKDWLLRADLNPKCAIEIDRFKNSQEFRERFAELNDLVKFLEKVTGKVFEHVEELFLLYLTFSVQREMGLKLPEWANKLFPNGRLLDAASLVFDTRNGNDKLKRLHGGMLLRKITDNFQRCQNGTLKNGRKIYLYSGHDLNVAALLNTLGIWKPHAPQFSSAVIMELLEIENKLFVKVIYYLGIPSEFTEMQLPGCPSKLCPLDEFLELYKNFIATDEDFNVSDSNIAQH